MSQNLCKLTTPEEAQELFYQITHLPSATAPRQEILSYNVPRRYKEGSTNLTLTVDANSQTYKLLRHIACNLEEFVKESGDTFNESKLVFSKVKTQNAFVNAYYLYEFLIGVAKLGDDIMVDDIATALGVSTLVLRKIMAVLRIYCRVLWVDPSAHYYTLKANLQAQKYGEEVPLENYKYDFNQLLFSECEISTHKLPLQLNFSINKRIWELLNQLCYTSTGNTPLSKLLANIKLISEHKRQNNSVLAVENYCPYICNYSLLEVDAENYTIDVVRNACNITKVMSFVKNKNTEVKFSSGRLFHPFHNLARWARENLIRFKGSPLVEAMDVHNAFFVFLVKIFRTVPTIERTELARFEDVVCRGKLYEEVMRFTGEVDRNAVKENLNAYKNAKTAQMRVMPEHEYFRKNYPTITGYLMDYPTYEKNGENVKFIQKDASYVETALMSRVCAALVAYGATPFSLHDAIYVSKDDKAMLDAKGVNVENLFWNEYKKLTDTEVNSLLFASRTSTFNL